MMLAHAGVLAQAGVPSGPPPFAYSDIPNQLLRINSREGSLAGSGAVLTGVTDVSGAGASVTVTGSPTYTATDSGLNNAPSFTRTAGTIVATGINRALIRFTAMVCYRPGVGNYYLWDADENSGRHYGQLVAGQFALRGTAYTASGEPVIGRKRMLVPNDGSSATQFNGAPLMFPTPYPVGSSAGSGIALGHAFDGSGGGCRIAFFMQCSSVPSAPLLADLEAKLITDFG